MESKKIAAERAVQLIKDGMIVGLGTGSTSYFAIEAIGARVKDGLSIKAIATSKQSEAQALGLNIPIVSFDEINEIDLTIDGADEVDSDLNLIKGGGGALLREKIVASASRELIIIVDESKIVPQLGTFPLPVEVVPFGIEATMRKLAVLVNCRLKIRQAANGQPFVTDNEHYIVDCYTQAIPNAEQLHHELNMIPGVVDNGLFVHMASKVFVGHKDGTVSEINKE